MRKVRTKPKFERPEWFPDWRGQIAVVVAGGPSAGVINYEPYKSRAKWIAVNYSWKLVPWADCLIGADGGFWNNHKGVQEFQGIKITIDPAASVHHGIHRILLDKMTYGFSLDKPGYVGQGANSGFYAINMALQFGSVRIIACGFDMNSDHGVHWHGVHPKGLNNPGPVQFRKWGPILDKQSKLLDQIGVKMINASLASSLKNYPKMPFEQAFAQLES